ncbi:MAG: hypothetical protein SGJ02_03085 [bacterium]|nr:hypothetical protein [bacterium]
MNGKLKLLSTNQKANLYSVENLSDSKVKKFIVTTPQTRAICNDPFVTGIRYTRDLSHACSLTLRLLKESGNFKGLENTTSVFHILRGGLNFGLRDALADAYTWNDHPSAFISAQRARKSDNPEDWFISESSYKKVHFTSQNDIVFGDVVATGTSLEYALREIGEIATEQKVEISSLLFFTIGGPRSHEIIESVDAEYRKRFKSYRGASVVYIEGIFAVAQVESRLSIKIGGTDLLRTEALLAPEFIESQYENPSFPLERCTIYDAGSRSFDILEYMEDVADYWSQTLKLSQSGMTYKNLLQERFPELASNRFESIDLINLCEMQIAKSSKFLIGASLTGIVQSHKNAHNE